MQCAMLSSSLRQGSTMEIVSSLWVARDGWGAAVASCPTTRSTVPTLISYAADGVPRPAWPSSPWSINRAGSACTTTEEIISWPLPRPLSRQRDHVVGVRHAACHVMDYRASMTSAMPHAGRGATRAPGTAYNIPKSEPHAAVLVQVGH